MLTTDFLSELQQALTAHYGKDIMIHNTEQLFGGDINQTWLLRTDAGDYFLKTNTAAYGNMFEKEFNGLQLLSSAKSIKIPEPIIQGKIDNTIFLVMEFIQKARPAKKFWKYFAEGLATLHQQSHTTFGLNEDNYIGSLAQSNGQCENWNLFYSTQRIMPLIRLAYNQKKCSADDMKTVERFCEKLDGLIPPEMASLLHGDLWSGNFMVAENGGPAIYDPAVYYGHREMDIAMTLLFGGFDHQFYHHYNEIFPLQAGWQQRIDICQLYPLLVHLILFGGHYYYRVMEIFKKYAG